MKTPLLKCVIPSWWEGRPAHLQHLPVFTGLEHFLLFCEHLLGKSSSKAFQIPAQSLFHSTSGVKCSILKPRWLVSLVKHTQDYFLIWIFSFNFSGVDFLSSLLITPLPSRFKSCSDATTFPPWRCLYSVIKSLLSLISDKQNRLCYKAHWETPFFFP